jgi:TRAP-type C4-dicarboxylate transport system substrate-binding protein
VASKYWNDLSDEQRAAITAAETEGKAVNDSGVVATESEAVAFMESKGLTVTTPDVAAFRAQVLDKFTNSDFAKDWPAGMLDRIKAAGA